MLKSIGTLVCVRSREVVCFWAGPLREAPLYDLNSQVGFQITYVHLLALILATPNSFRVFVCACSTVFA